MPMPPPKPSAEGARGPQVRREIDQILRALDDLGPTDVDRLAEAVGARYWEPRRFEQAVAYAVADGLAVRDTGGLLNRV